MLFDIHRLRWAPELLDLLAIPEAMLPDVRPSSHVYGHTTEGALGAAVPIAGCAGDQQAALFGQACFDRGMTKNTYGTGCFLLMNTGPEPVASEHGLLTTIAWGIDDRVEYALEGSVFIAGAAVQWLRDELGLVEDAADTEALAASVTDSAGVHFVPAFAGLGAPWWDPDARGVLIGLTRGTTKAHIVRATLEALALQSYDVLHAMEEDAHATIPQLRVDGGASVNDLLMQIQADILGAPVVRPAIVETTALGAAYLAGLATGFWSGRDELAAQWSEDRRFAPSINDATRRTRLADWHRAVERSRGWATDA
jgi:glycerol kinase